MRDNADVKYRRIHYAENGNAGVSGPLKKTKDIARKSREFPGMPQSNRKFTSGGTFPQVPEKQEKKGEEGRRWLKAGKRGIERDGQR